MDSSLDLLVWRAALAKGPAAPDIHDQLRAAALYEAVGLAVPARMLREAAYLRHGFSPRAVAARAGAPAAAPDAASGAGIAIEEIRRFAQAMSVRLAAALPAAAAQPTEPPPPAGDLGKILHRLCAFLANPDPAAGAGDAEAAAISLCEASRRAAGFDYRAFAAAPLPLLATAVAFAGVQDFVSRNRNLLLAPNGSAEFLHRVARFDDGGLGPYFTNVPRIARRSRDIFELADVACRADVAGGGNALPREQWVLLLSQQLTGPLRDEVVDDLADLGALAALTAIFERASAQPEHRVEANLIARLRDAALDNGDYDLATRAQALIVRLRPDNLLEREILGSIDATVGRFAAAEQSFLACLRRRPDDGYITERLVAVRAGRFDPYAVRQGFGTPKDRQLTRLRRRHQAPAEARVERRRAVAVEL